MMLVLPYPPSVNHYWRCARGKTFYVSAAGRAYRTHVGLLVAAQREPTLAGDVGMRIKVYPPDSRRRDLDNILKALLDALQAARVYHDDNQISRLQIERQEVVAGGEVEVQLWSNSPRDIRQ